MVVEFLAACPGTGAGQGIRIVFSTSVTNNSSFGMQLFLSINVTLYGMMVKKKKTFGFDTPSRPAKFHKSL